jgi:hypothetical protein
LLNQTKAYSTLHGGASATLVDIVGTMAVCLLFISLFLKIVQFPNPIKIHIVDEFETNSTWSFN